MAEIHLVLTDDWELRGDGSGHMPRLQFEPLERLIRIYERHGLRGTFTVEVMQQWAHLEAAPRHPELADLARAWEAHVRDLLRRGHDVQLHLHPQWHGAAYDGGRWHLDAPWSLLDHPPERVRALVRRGRAYLHELLTPIDPAYRCVAFRGGSWCVAPGTAVTGALVENGFEIDVSLVHGVRYDNAQVRLDYRDLDEPFLPFYPELADARRMAAAPQPLVCLPTHTFDYTPAAKLRHLGLRSLARLPGLGRTFGDWRHWESPDSTPIEGGGSGDYAVWDREERVERARPRSRLARWRAHYLATTHYISNLPALSFPLMREMLRDLRRRAAASGAGAVPVVLENHTKDLGRFEPIERLAAHLSRQNDLRVVTLRDVAAGLRSGLYPIRMRPAA